MSFLIAFAALIDDPNDLHAFNELVALYQTEMLRIARSVIHDYQLAEDAVQDAWYGIAVSYKKIPVQNPKVLHAYCLSCAKHAALRIRQREQRFETTELIDISDAAPGSDATFAAVVQSSDYARLLAAIRQLGEPYQDVLLHYYVFDQSIREIAKLFGRPGSTIKTQLFRGRKLLAEICRKEGIIGGETESISL